MYPKKRAIPIQCYRGREKLGEKTPKEWAAELGVNVNTIYSGKSTGVNVCGANGEKYQFYDCGAEPYFPPVSLSEKEAEARARGKTYGQLQAEETLARIGGLQSKEKEEVMEISTDEMKPAEIASEGLALSQFAELTDETTIVVYQGNDWILTAPCESLIFKDMDWKINCFKAQIIDGVACLKVWVGICT